MGIGTSRPAKVSILDMALRLVNLGLSTYAQEEAGIRFDPQLTGEFTWQNLIHLMLLVCAGFGLWKLSVYLLERHRTRIPWRALRRWWPASMVVWFWLVAALLLLHEPANWASAAMLAAFGLLNIPGLLLTSTLMAIIDPAPGWLPILCGTPSIWVGSYLTIRLAEWRAWLNSPTLLHLAGEDTTSSGED